MLLSELLRTDLIKINLEAHSNYEAVSELIDLLVQRHEIPLSRRAEVIAEVQAHEKSNVTGMEGGVAVPHAATDYAGGVAVPHAVTDYADDLICAMGISKRGIDFHATDGKLSSIVILTLAPKRNFVGEVRLLAGIQHLFTNATLKDKILSSGTPDAVYDALQDAEQHL